MAPIFVTTWYLEMRARPPVRRAETPPGIVLTQLERPPVAEYRVLYDTVGRDYHWVDRRRIDDAELASLIHDPFVEIHAARHAEGLVGYFELDRATPGECKLAYFGLAPAWIGRGVGAWFLERAVQRAWDGTTHRVTVHTCSLDHPRALATYERAGFVRIDEAYADFDPDPSAPRHDPA
ncbi:MAG TPA: GNAT family N-acetyltransferase [Polyangiaceae bacterium]|nr:GNAT family N-acetyltransferase [Polyangiaceae bacterium]